MQAEQLHLARHTARLVSETDFAGWRDAARVLASGGVAPEDVAWMVDAVENRQSVGRTIPEASEDKGTLTVPRAFIARAEAVICHSDPARFALLYRLLWRLRHEPKLLEIASDPDIRRFEAMEKAVGRDMHKMRAFVRFRKIGEGEAERFVAWFEPSHHIVARNAPFFVRRFTGMRWTILTPHASATWDGEILAIGPGAAKADAPAEDATEALWQTYFENIFNPARLKVQAMQKEMPKKYWRNLPEASLIPDLIAGADKAAKEMIARMPTSPAPHHAKVQARHWPARGEEAPDDGAKARSIAALREAAKGCRRCPLWREATQTVFGEGPETASVIFVGEQPGDQEDIAGKPFVGPAGKVFDAILDDAEIDRLKTYVTNAVKHFKFEPRGKRRIHSKPNAGEVQACRWWLDKELELIKPNLVVAMGATAAQALLGKAIPVTKMRGEVIEREDGLRVFITIHPSFILRIPDPADKEAERARFMKDMKAVKALME
ncbi:DNA polymerase [Mesorhizobium sp. Root554]|uniref:UdgX family uracil-DNA binding protein n=1 Tax=unclassified Mesorhizobium TaxID=325217 RepID=UPI0006FD9FBE|nr:MULTISPECIES: UdgX family uracil-DNA binding protein [unclassified Mesorhizobium]KQZ12683.1 DNA polymerase [Mesorhizobium sp. Root1471]KQZ35205.1 DNA polymerase [Mesorhizobium sp. Root554]